MEQKNTEPTLGQKNFMHRHKYTHTPTIKALKHINSNNCVHITVADATTTTNEQRQQHQQAGVRVKEKRKTSTKPPPQLHTNAMQLFQIQ